MEAIKRRKKYKAKAPIQTINEIKHILQSELGFTLQETFFNDDKSRFHSCRISINSDELEEFEIGTNGKGIDKNYALASAYGEFMERIQNNVLLLHNWVAKPRFFRNGEGLFSAFERYLGSRGALLKYDIAPDEKYIVDKHESPLNSNGQNILENVKNGEVLHLPFYDVFKNTIKYIPAKEISLRCTSNGMCAGNTPKEAMIQGICEIIERYAMRLIYEKNLSLPSISKELFRGNLIYNHIVELEETRNWTIKIKDCSCNIGLPAVGILIIDKSKIGYHFHIGSDPSPVTALERSLTEIYQGRKDILFQPFDMGHMIKVENESIVKEVESNKTFADSTGQFPLSILSLNNSYEFEGFDERYGLSDDSDLQLLTDLIKELGFEMFVRDVSFLGFPTYRIYIPRMSEIYYIFDNSYLPLDKYFFIGHNLEQATREDAEFLIDGMLTGRITSTLRFINSFDDINKDYNLSMFLLYVKIDNYKMALDYLVKYIRKKPDASLFYMCLRDVIYAKYYRIEDTSFLFNLYDAEMINKFDSMLNQDRLLELFNLSSCFNCENCKIADSCKILSLINVSKRIENVFEKHIPNQTELAKYFRN